MLAVVVAGSASFAVTPPDPGPRGQPELHVVQDGVITLSLDASWLEAWGVCLVARGHIGDAGGEDVSRPLTFSIEPGATLAAETRGGRFDRLVGGSLDTLGAVLVDKSGERNVIGNLALVVHADQVMTIDSTLGDGGSVLSAFRLESVMIDFLPRHGVLSITGDLLITEAWAAAMDRPDLARLAVGFVEVEAGVIPFGKVHAPAGSCAAEAASETASGTVAAEGPDVLVAELQSVIRYGREGDITAYAVGTTACNIGTERASWVSYTNQHPVIIMNLYRLKDDQFEQVGMSWVKHGFYAVSQSLCSHCTDLTDGSELGVGCSDPYSAHLNGVQTNMSPRSTVNPHTGYFPYPWGGPAPVTMSERRIQVHDADLEPAFNVGARYFIEGHYVTPGDCTAGTQDNNASYREVALLNPTPGEYTLAINHSFSTQRGQAAVRAWKDADPTVFESDIRVPGEGLFILAANSTQAGTGIWRYTYALQNLNSDRAARSFTVPIPKGAVVGNIYFRDVEHHSGEPYDTTDWVATVGDGTVTWSTVPYDVNANANALRYDSIFTFAFDSNVEPASNMVTLGLFKPGPINEITARSTGPKLDLIDCNGNDVADACDIDCSATDCGQPCGGSADCNANDVPDDCEPDCNANGVADSCDVDLCPPGDQSCLDCNANMVPDGCEVDCDGDGIPDACDPPDDSDGDGVNDCIDLCPLTSPEGACACPPLGRCCFPIGYCLDDYPHAECVGQGGTPDCLAAPCRQGCLLGDYDMDGDLDLRDMWMEQSCFSGSTTDGGYTIPPQECSIPLDFDEDGDVDRSDFRLFRELCTGPR